MRPASLKHLLTKPALLIAAGLVLLGAAAGGASDGQLGGSAATVGGTTCRTTKPSLDALCRYLSASFVSEDDGAFAHAGLHAAFEPTGVLPVDTVCVRAGREGFESQVPWRRLRQCPVGPSPPGAVGAGV